MTAQDVNMILLFACTGLLFVALITMRFELRSMTRRLDALERRREVKLLKGDK